MVAVNVTDLQFSYPLYGGQELPIIKGISFSVEQGELVAIQGPSGSGKSTLLYILGGLLTHFSGQVKIFDKNVTTLSDLERATLRNQSIGFVFQQFHLLAKATVRENILLPLDYPTEIQQNPVNEEQLLRIARDLGLEDRLDHLPNQLSGGQQQRVAIARALVRDTRLILADEPTGSLDTQNAIKTMEILRAAQQRGRTVIIITHDPEIAAQCDRVIFFRDGHIESDSAKKQHIAKVVAGDESFPPPKKISRFEQMTKYLRTSLRVSPIAFKSLLQNKSRTLLTMLGIIIGVAAVLSMVTVGKYTKRKILDSYAELGVNTMLFYGWPNWDLKAVDRPPAIFQGFDWDRDLNPLLKIFPELNAISPILFSWNITASFGGVTTDADIRLIGTTPDGIRLSNKNIMQGNTFSPFHIANRSAVCILGYDVYDRLFKDVNAIGQIIFINKGDRTFGCRVIGIAAPHNSNKDWNNPNLQIIVPYSFFQGISTTWESFTRQVLMETKPGEDVQAVGLGVRAFFEKRYGKSAMFNIGSDSVLIAQMNKFLNMFTVLLGMIAFVSLAVGGIGITNMMLVSVSERLKEIGIRKAFGATHFSIRVQYLVEAIAICGVAGLAGIVFGFVAYQGAIYGATKLIPNLQFEWVFDWQAIALSFISILAVGILSGLIPALKAEKLEVIEALRSE
ncbi:MAG: ATP-binding cassette domain-containing protein [Bdellovibrionaceae bacterium]|nr:ATP-binding cassette domain-containing protein [Pseudobdellovibrionaceae bacterium]